jgi:H/ACA ribonucleoprotein complex subunit 2
MDTESPLPLHVSPIANPMASEKMDRKLLQLTRKLVEPKCLKRGVKECVKHIRKGNPGLCLLAADVSPVDVYSHIPVLCEENGVPYIFVRSQLELGQATASNNPTSVAVLVSPEDSPDLKEKYDALCELVRQANPFIS